MQTTTGALAEPGGAVSTGGYQLGAGERFTENELQLLGLSADEPYTRMEFDNSATVSYWLCQSFCVACGGCWWPLWIFFCPCLYCAIQGQAESRLGAVTGKQIVYKQMVYSCCCCCENVTTKTVPLSKVTDLSIHQGCIQKMFDIKQISVETASSPAPEIILFAAKRPYELRQLVLKMRDGGADAGGGNGGLSSAATASLIANNQLSQQTYALDTSRNQTLNEIRDVLVDVRAGLANLGAINNAAPRYAPMNVNTGGTGPVYG